MPPEQALGGEITARSDLYSTGCMLYEMVTGRPPFVGDDNIAIIGQHLNTPPVSPSWHRPDLPKGLETLILRLLEKDPNKRPASAAEVRQALAAIDLRPIDVGAQGAVPSHGAPSNDNPLYRRTFVGREAELCQLQSAFDGAISGQGSLAMVVGEPGIGKTALVEQLATYVSLRGGRTLVGHSYEEGSLSLPYLAFVEAMRSYVLARAPEALKSELGTGAADVARIVSEIRDRVQVELRPPGDPEDDRWRLFQSVTSFLRNASQVQPLLVVVEDLHWADRGTLDLLLHVARNLSGAGVNTQKARQVKEVTDTQGGFTMYERILVPLDGSELAEGALPHAREIAKQTGSEVVLLQAVTPFVAMLGQAAATEAAAFVGPSTAAVAPIVTEEAEALARRQHEGIVSSAREYLGRWANELSKEGIKARAEIAEGAPAQVILDYAQANSVGLIAMSTHGRAADSVASCSAASPTRCCATRVCPSF